MSVRAAELVLAAFGAAAIAITGGALALLARRIHPELSLLRLWLYYSLLVGLIMAVAFTLVFF